MQGTASHGSPVSTVDVADGPPPPAATAASEPPPGISVGRKAQRCVWLWYEHSEQFTVNTEVKLVRLS